MMISPTDWSWNPTGCRFVAESDKVLPASTTRRAEVPSLAGKKAAA